MPKAWTGKMVGRMHIHNIKLKDLAEKFDFSVSFLGMVLHGERNMENAEARINDAINQIIEERRAARQLPPSRKCEAGENECQK